MNPTIEQPLPPLQPPQLPRLSFSCDKHPTEQFTGFCPSCLCERLTSLDPSSRQPSNAAAPSSTAAAALKAIFRITTTTTDINNNKNKNINKTSSSSSSFLFPELRRTQSFSASKNEGFSGVFEPQRHSCDVRGRNTLWSLFNLHDERKNDRAIEVEVRNSVSSVVTSPVLEAKEEEDEVDEQYDLDSNHDEIRVSHDSKYSLEENVIEEAGLGGEIVEEDNFTEEVKTMKDHIDLDSQAKKKIAGSFWSAASVFSKKWHKWRQKQKMKQRKTAGESPSLQVKKPVSRHYRETQSEIADYGFGRRSCDTDPRFSLDAGRISYDDPRYSFDEPRASWDGHLIGTRNFPRLLPMLSVVEDSPVVHVSRSDAQIPIEQPVDCVNGEMIPGGTVQTREYYLDSSSSRRRKSLDRSNSIRKTAAAVVAEIDEMKAVSNAKVTPATVNLVDERELRQLNSISMRADCSETCELGFRDNASVVGNGEGKGLKKYGRWRAWNIWGFIHKRNGGNKDEDDERYKHNSRGNGVERSFSESWQELRRGKSNGDVRIGGFNRRVFRSNSSVSSRNSYNMDGSFGSVRKPSVETNGNGKKRRDDFGLERNRSARYSPNHIDNGLLRFYLTPMRSSSRRGGLGKSKSNNNTHSITEDFVANVLKNPRSKRVSLV